MNRRQKMKLLKQENDRLKGKIVPVRIVNEPLKHMRCSTCMDMRDAWISPELTEQIVVERLCQQMADVIKEKVIEEIDSDALSPRRYTFDFWVRN